MESYCYRDFRDAENITITAALLLDDYANKSDDASKMAFMKACNNSNCYDALKTVMGYMDDHYDKDCHIVARLYDNSPFYDGITYKGWRDYFLLVAGYT